MLPSILAKQLVQGIGDYIETTFPMSNAPFRGSVQKMVDQPGAVFHHPYVSVRLPFRVAPSMPTCFAAIQPAYLPYVHQQKAFDRLCGDDGRSTLVATGTGSGKTECFLYPIVDYCYRHRGEPGIKALIIYPMNALASDQARRIAQLIYHNPKLRGNVSVGMYVGGKEDTPSLTMTEDGVITEHNTMLNCPPDILLTNYKMLDYLLVRPRDAALWQDNGMETLKYIAVDELHTFDGAQGTDLACLLRRLKHRLSIQPGYLCCVGTSATMGSKDNNSSILEYAKEIFGEFFDRDAVITEDRLSPEEFFSDTPITEYALPDARQLRQLDSLAWNDDPAAYLKLAVEAWFPEAGLDSANDMDRIALGELLKHHSFMQAVIRLTGGRYHQVVGIAEKLVPYYPILQSNDLADTLINSLFALISHARTGSAGGLRPFLQVQVQLWMRELRRLLGKVDPEEINYEIDINLEKDQQKHYLPVINCRDCGATGWASVLDPKMNTRIRDLETFYNLYFSGNSKVLMMFPGYTGEVMPGMHPGRLCPECLQFKDGDQGSELCDACGGEMIDVQYPIKPDTTGSKDHKQFVCPCCSSKRGLALMGVRSATEISASISQLFASRFNDDKKTLAFSDNVQDAAHRAGFFNSRTWRFGLRTAMQKYCNDGGADQTLEEFQNGLVAYWHSKLSREAFVSFFIAPNMTWMHAYEDMVEKRSLGKGKSASMMMADIEKRIKYEVLLEYGVAGRTGRTLEKSGCSVLAFDVQDVQAIAAAVGERAVNELGILHHLPPIAFQRMVLGYLGMMKQGGAFRDPVFDEYTMSDGSWYKLTNDYNRWLPGIQSGRNTPRFVAEEIGKVASFSKGSKNFDLLSSPQYLNWLRDNCDTDFIDKLSLIGIGRLILEEGVKNGVIAIAPSSPKHRIYSLNKGRLHISNLVARLRCCKCGREHAASREEASLWAGAPCTASRCGGVLEVQEAASNNYYAHLYQSGDMARINAREHTGLLQRDDREDLEHDFKRSREDQALWDPNVLSCTPTLEMGIDIGDLSSVILCSMPPAQSQFLQRAGRAGRKDGNALTLAVANARPHDMYFYADPMDMIAGEVMPPHIFLQATAVLERQFVAFCMDSWVKTGIAENAIPKQVSVVLKNLKDHPVDMFPFNFIAYVQNTLTRQLNQFLQMFASYLDDNAREDLEAFARGKNGQTSPMTIKLLDAFQGLKHQQESLISSEDELKKMIKELESKPQDSSYQDEIKELRSELGALLAVRQELGRKNVFNFLSDEGLLPNYAFPEEGIILRTVLYRKEEDAKATSSGKKKPYEKLSYEYSRSASSALSEFAPLNHFYAGGRKLTVDQVDLTTAKTAKWRLCPNCSHAQLEEAGKAVATCPQCGDPGWADAGQVRSMLKVQMVYSNMDYTKTLISDESDDRTAVFYTKQMLVDVDEDNDISKAYRMDNNAFPFGYEFVRKATLREINFGEKDITGDTLTISGVEAVRKGFTICKYCGKIQPPVDKRPHALSCKVKKMPALAQMNAFEECLFLYREFNTEILRLLIPATNAQINQAKTESFVAAFMLGMREYFGNVDHLRATVTEVPVEGAASRKQYLVIYDSVPGGTGYLKQLMKDTDALLDVFQKSLSVLENCSCKNDDKKDGCYHCLYAYRQSQKIGSISRKAAISMLKDILSGKENRTEIKGIHRIPVNPIIDSELEAQFIEVLRQKVGTANVSDSMRNGKHCYYIKLQDTEWELEPQVSMDAASGVSVYSKPDFVLWPTKASGHKPVAVFTDGFSHHKDIVTDDTKKRTAICRTGAFRVWSLSYEDVFQAFGKQTDYYTPTLEAQMMPYGKTAYQKTVKGTGATAIQPADMSAFDLLVAYLKMPDAEQVFSGQAKAYAMSLLNPMLLSNKQAFDLWKGQIDAVNMQTNLTDEDYTFKATAFGTFTPRTQMSDLTIYAGLPVTQLNKDTPAVFAILQDDQNSRGLHYQEEWNGMWHFCNIMQFCDRFIALSSTGLAQDEYMQLLSMWQQESVPTEAHDSPWDTIIEEELFDDEAKAFAQLAKQHGLPVPDEIGYEFPGSMNQSDGEAEMVWTQLRLAFLTREQIIQREAIEAKGYRIVDLLDIQSKDDAKALFGGRA